MSVPHLTATDEQLEFLLSVFCYASILCGTEASAVTCRAKVLSRH